MKIFKLLFLFIFLSFIARAETFTIYGTYQGEPIYVHNPTTSDGKDFSISAVYVNDKPYTDIQSTAFQIVFTDFKIGQYVEVKIVHKDFEKPKILNPEALYSESTFEIVSIKATEDQLKWTTKNETNEEPFIVEHFRNNKWVEIAHVIGKGPEGYNNYSVQVNHHSGRNIYRLKQRNKDKHFRYEGKIEYESSKSPISFEPKRVSDVITLSQSTDYEIFSSNGLQVKKGTDKLIDVSDLNEGVYWLNIDNRTEKFYKK